MKMRSPSLAWNRTARTRDPHLTLPLRRPPRGAERARVRSGEPHAYESAHIDPSFYLKVRGPLRGARRHAQGRRLSELRQAVRDRHGGGADDVASARLGHRRATRRQRLWATRHGGGRIVDPRAVLELINVEAPGTPRASRRRHGRPSHRLATLSPYQICPGRARAKGVRWRIGHDAQTRGSVL